MPLDDRTYTRGDSQPERYHGGGGGLMGGLPRPTPAVKILLLANLGIFFLQLACEAGGIHLSAYFGVTVEGAWQFWRYLSFQFLHDTRSIFHLGLNMLGLYFLGTPLEQSWGTRRFVWFYLTCGATAGLAYVVMGAIMHLPSYVPIIGASGGVYGIVLACAVLFPHFRLIFLFFPVPIRLAAIIIFGGMILVVLSALGQGVTGGAMSDVAHLGGAVAAAFWLWGLPYIRWQRRPTRVVQPLKQGAQHGAWQRRMQQRQIDQDVIDRILKKIHDEGLASLTDKEKRALHEATQRQRDEDRRIGKL
ncbi:MAG: rhomboid family intramembrane serine protease [Phycisphaerae bacterium]|jgi:membrane associated rhomboid family serine protease